MRRTAAGWIATVLVLGSLQVGSVSAQDAAAPAAPAAADAKGPLPVANAGDQVLVKREAVRLISPDKYKVNLTLEPFQRVVLSAPYDAIVRQVTAKPNAKLKSQTEVARLENTVQKLNLQKAQAAVKAATIEQKAADKSDENAVALAAAKVDAARAEFDLAQHFFDQTSIRTPLAGEVLRVWVVDGQYVRAGDPLVEVGDLSQMKVEIPVDRKLVDKAKPFSIKVEAAEVEGKIEAILPLHERFDPLRDLFESVASATVVIANPDDAGNSSGKKYQPGQTVYVPFVPRQPVVEVPASAVLNKPDGTRRVQALRQGVVRDLGIVVMGPIGLGRLYVSGPFTAGDEVIYESSHQLPDGFQLRPFAAAAAAGPAAGPAQPSTRPDF